MVRISNTLLPTNASGVPQSEITNTSFLVTNAGLSDLAASINSNKVDVNIASGGFDGVVSGSVGITGNVSVVQSSTINGSSGNLSSSQSVVSGDVSTAVDVGSYTKNTVSITTTGTNEIKIYISSDGGSNYFYFKSCYPMNSNCVEIVNDVACDRIRLEYTGTETVTASVFSRA